MSLFSRTPSTDITPEVRIAKTPAEKEKIYKFRQETLGTQRDALDDSATLLYVETDGALVASMRVNRLDRTELSSKQEEWLGIESFYKRFPSESLSYSSHLCVAPKWRRTVLLGKVLEFAYTLARENSVQFDFVTCAPAQIGFYEMLGYRRYKTPTRDAEGKELMPLVCVTEDVDYFRSVGSVLFPLAKRFHNDSEAARWFVSESFARRSANHIDVPVDDAVWGVLGSRLEQESMPLFRGLAKSEADKFLDACEVHTFKEGDRIVHAGDLGHEMFVVLSGEVEVRRTHNDISVTLGTFHSGDVFGEISFLMSRRRTADVVALTDGELLELSQEFLKEAMKTLPETTMKVLYNLSNVLCERLCATTVQLLIANTSE